MNALFKGIFDNELTKTISITDFLLCLGVSLVLGLILALAYSHKSEYTKSFLQPENNRETKKATSSIYILHRITMPAVLVECGFLSNPEEAERLCDSTYQQALAMVMFKAICEVGMTA